MKYFSPGVAVLAAVLLQTSQIVFAAAPAEQATIDAQASSEALAALQKFLSADDDAHPPLAEQPFAKVPLTKADADAAGKLLWEDHAGRVRRDRAEEMQQRVLKLGELAMPFAYRIFGDAPANGRSLYISMHGGGGAPKSLNDSQWQNQKRLYEPSEGIYLAPRAPTDTWDLWHQPHVDRFFDRLIENLVVLENVDPNRVYLLGYSAGGDGVYKLAPRMADRWAAAAMMAGHPNGVSLLSLRNLPFTIHVGGNDAAYNRNTIAQQYADELTRLRKADPQGYEHWAKIYPNKGHWMDREDAAAIPWMARFDRNPTPSRVVWKQDNVTHTRFYWLAVNADNRKAGSLVTAELEGQNVNVQAEGLERLIIRFNDRMLNLDQPVTVTIGGATVFHGHAPRTSDTLATTLSERGDPQAVFSGQIEISTAGENAP